MWHKIYIQHQSKTQHTHFIFSKGYGVEVRVVNGDCSMRPQTCISHHRPAMLSCVLQTLVILTKDKHWTSAELPKNHMCDGINKLQMYAVFKLCHTNANNSMPKCTKSEFLQSHCKHSHLISNCKTPCKKHVMIRYNILHPPCGETCLWTHSWLIHHNYIYTLQP